MDIKYQRRKFTELRFEYYTSGRTLWFSDTMSIAGMLLGHSIELTLKHILIEKNSLGPADKNSHFLLPLYKQCETLDAITPGTIPHDLIQYVSDMLNQRYPSMAVATQKAAQKRNHAIGNAITLIHPYDELTLLLDESLQKLCPRSDISIGRMAAHFVNRPQGRSFFHCNIAASRRYDLYRDTLLEEYKDAEARMRKDGLNDQTISYNLQLHQQRLSTWLKAPNSIWHYEKLHANFMGSLEDLSDVDFISDFQYPGSYQVFE
jgi:hypothetical protein